MTYLLRSSILAFLLSLGLAAPVLANEESQLQVLELESTEVTVLELQAIEDEASKI